EQQLLLKAEPTVRPLSTKSYGSASGLSILSHLSIYLALTLDSTCHSSHLHFSNEETGAWRN
ncbi:hypothetical protein ACQP3L_38685, partial [Escherichia coli]